MRYTDIEKVIKKMYIAPGSSDKLFEIAVNRSKRAEGRGRKGLEKIKNKEIRRIEIAADYVAKTLRKIALSSPFIEELHPFYQELFSIIINSYSYRCCLSFLYKSSRLIERISKKYIKDIIHCNEKNSILRIRKSFFGRLKSILEDLDDCMRKIRVYQLEILKLPALNPEISSIIIAGAPNVGKSSILKVLTRAKPEIKPYPFTTKEIIVGHIESNGKRIQVIDTPGLLDRPLEEKNNIEKRAILAMKHFKGLLLYVFDPTETCGFTIKYQCSILTDIIEMFPRVEKIIIFNKMDMFDKEHINRIFLICDVVKRYNIVEISALKGLNIEELKRIIHEKIK